MSELQREHMQDWQQALWRLLLSSEEILTIYIRAVYMQIL